MSNALVTGASGFVGAILSDYLESQGWRVFRCGYPPAEGVMTCDVRDARQIEAVLDQAPDLDCIFHLGAITFVPASGRDPVAAMEVNLNGTIRLLTALQRRHFQGRFLFVSTAEVYGPPQELPITESHPLNPQNPYAVSKAAADTYCAWLQKSTGFDLVRMRPFNHSGAGQSDQFVLSSFARQIAEAEQAGVEGLLRVGNLAAARDFLHVEDVVRAYELAARKGHSGAVYNIASGHATVIQDALDALVAQSRCPIRIEPDPARMRPLEVVEICGSAQHLHEDTGWTPQRPFEAILSDLLNAWRNRLSA